MGAGWSKLHLAHVNSPVAAACPAGEAESTFAKTLIILANRDTNYSNSQDHQLRSQFMRSQ